MKIFNQDFWLLASTIMLLITLLSFLLHNRTLTFWLFGISGLTFIASFFMKSKEEFNYEVHIAK